MDFKSYAIKAVDTLFTRFGETAQISFDDATTADLAVIHRFPDKIVELMDSRVHTETDLFDVRAVDITGSKKLTQIILGGKTYIAHGEPMLDQHGLVLRVEAYAT